MINSTHLNEVHYYHMFNTVQKALKKQIITVYEPMYLDILNDGMVGFENITAWEMRINYFSPMATSPTLT
jgi:hypothetical protein